MEMNKDFQKFAASNCGISSITLDGYEKIMSNYISPVIPEERKMNVTTMDVFSRLLMDRIVFLGVPINDDVGEYEIVDIELEPLKRVPHNFAELLKDELSLEEIENLRTSFDTIGMTLCPLSTSNFICSKILGKLSIDSG